MTSDSKYVKNVNLVLDGSTATFPGAPVAALPEGDMAVIYYEPGDDETSVASFGNGDGVPVSATHLTSIGSGTTVRHLYVVTAA